jgi:D-alanine-D-alanine ligase
MKEYQNKKINVCVLAGGVSPEHVISIVSASSVVNNLDKEKYNIHVIGIEKNTGEWRYYPENDFYEHNNSIDSYMLKKESWFPVVIKPGEKPVVYYVDNSNFIPVSIDVFFPVMHGLKSEDGTIQGLIEILDIPIVGCKTLSSAMAMDKNVSKILAQSSSIPVVPWYCFYSTKDIDLDLLINQLGLPLFIKPSSAGSSIGISKINKKEELLSAIKNALKYSDSVLVEKTIDAREIEVAVLGDWKGKVRVSVPGEIIPLKDFYTYEAKYKDDKGAELVAPAKLDEEITKRISIYAEKIFRGLKCTGMARVDFFLERTSNDLYFNEINTIPGFTNISMYPRLWSETGISYTDLLDELIKIGMVAK